MLSRIVTVSASALRDIRVPGRVVDDRDVEVLLHVPRCEHQHTWNSTDSGYALAEALTLHQPWHSPTWYSQSWYNQILVQPKLVVTAKINCVVSLILDLEY